MMQVTALQQELRAIHVRTRQSIGVSVIAHLLLVLFLSLWKAVTPEPMGITEITWIDPIEAVPVDAMKALAKSEPAPVPEASSPQMPTPASEKFQRTEEVADLAPRPQTLKRVDTRLNDRLASLQATSRPTPKPIVAVETPNPVGRPKLAGLAEDPGSSEPTDLKRTTVTSTPNPVALKRTKTRVQKAAVSTDLPDFRPDRAQPDAVETQARRTMAGAQMAGPVADRPIRSYETPTYPEWAKREGVEGSVMIYFIVLPDGSVKKNVMVQKTSGFADFDENALEAILAWRFEPLKRGQTGEQWGTIMFHYRLSDAP